MRSDAMGGATLSEAVWPAGKNNELRRAALVVIGVCLLTLSAKFRIPFEPVPFTMQTFVVLALGMAYGARMALVTVGAYLALGAAGAPVFTGTPEKGVGIAYMMGTTGGYLFGFLISAGVVGWLAERGWDRSVVWTALAMVIGSALIYAPGVLWLGNVVGWDKPVLEWGLTNFLLSDALKVALAAAAMPLAWRFVRPRS